MPNARLALLCLAGLACVALWPRQLFSVPQVRAPAGALPAPRVVQVLPIAMVFLNPS